jgi:thioredoxin 1
MIMRSRIQSSFVGLRNPVYSRALSTANPSNFIVPDNAVSLDIIEKGSNKKILYFTASWCPPCRFIGPKFEAAAANFPTISFVKIDIDQFDSMAIRYRIQSVPTFVFANGSKTTDSFSGADEAKLLRSIQNLANV